MGAGTDEFNKTIAKWLATILCVVAIILSGQQAYKYYTKKNTPDKKPNVIVNAKVVKQKVERKGDVIKVTQEIVPDPIKVETKKGREQFIYYVQPETIHNETKVEIPKLPKLYAVGYYKTPTYEGLGITHGIIYLPMLFDSRLSTGIFVGKDKLDNYRGAWMFTLSKEIIPNVAIAVGQQYGLDTGWETNVGVQYEW